MGIKFYCKKLWVSEEEKQVYLEGIVEEGNVLSGMSVGIKFNNYLDMWEPIQGVETINNDNTHLRLKISYIDEDEKDLWLALNVGDEYIKIE